MRIFTGALYPYPDGGQAYFDREAGLLSRGFEALGIDSGSITFGPAAPNDLPSMIRASRSQLENPEWWSALNLDGLVLITWANFQFKRIVEAAMKAGIPVAQWTDTQGIHSPVADWQAHLQAERAHYWHEPRWKQIARTLAKLPVTMTARIVHRDLRDARTISASDYFFAPTPRAAARYQNLTRRLQGAAAASKALFVPFPVNFHFNYTPTIPKREEVVAVGRWDSRQKRTPLLTGTIERALQHRPGITFRIFGQRSPELDQWHQRLEPSLRNQVIIEGLVPNSKVAEAYQRAKVILVSAAYEGCHNASAEAICSGVSVVGCRSPFLGVLEWHASRNSGRLAEDETPESLSQTLIDELNSWDRGERDPEAISNAWIKELRADHVAAQILGLFSKLPNGPRPKP